MTKNDIRKISKSIIIKEKPNKDLIISEKVFSLDEYKLSKSIFVYLSTENEVSTSTIIEQAFRDNKKVYVPVTTDIMTLVRVYPKTKYRAGFLGIKEPETPYDVAQNATIDFTIVPMVAADRRLNRLGHGRGFYDKWLNKNSTFKVGLCFFERVFDEIPIELHDIKMDMVITEKETYKY